jgi:hypothetical protein
MAVYEAAARYLVRHYVPNPAVDGPVAALCLTVGRQARVPVRQQKRETEWDPDPELLRRLRGAEHPVVPVSQCGWDEHLREVHLPTGGRGVVVALGHPSWVSRASVYLEVTSRESESYAFRYGCRLSWSVDQWSVDHCLSPDRRRR